LECEKVAARKKQPMTGEPKSLAERIEEWCAVCYATVTDGPCGGPLHVLVVEVGELERECEATAAATKRWVNHCADAEKRAEAAEARLAERNAAVGELGCRNMELWQALEKELGECLAVKGCCHPATHCQDHALGHLKRAEAAEARLAMLEDEAPEWLLKSVNAKCAATRGGKG